MVSKARCGANQRLGHVFVIEVLTWYHFTRIKDGIRFARLTLRQLEYLISVGETGSIARASEALNVSSPSISAAISQLEEELGFSLFVRRHAQGLSQTPGVER